jgi:hypothetical protein
LISYQFLIVEGKRSCNIIRKICHVETDLNLVANPVIVVFITVVIDDVICTLELTRLVDGDVVEVIKVVWVGKNIITMNSFNGIFRLRRLSNGFLGLSLIIFSHHSLVTVLIKCLNVFVRSREMLFLEHIAELLFFFDSPIKILVAQSFPVFADVFIRVKINDSAWEDPVQKFV